MVSTGTRTSYAHLPMDDMDQFEAFQRLLKEGRSIEDIAKVFDVTELTVKRRLAIANLAFKIRRLYRTEDIDADTGSMFDAY